MELQDWLSLIGRVLLGGYFIQAGIMHIVKRDMLAGYAASKGVPLPKAAVLLSGFFFLLLPGVSILLGQWLVTSYVLVLVFLTVVSFAMHAFWRVSDPMAKMNDRVNFLKNFALAGAVLSLLAGLFV